MNTQHRFDGGRRGPCLRCLERAASDIKKNGGYSKKQLAARARREKEFHNPRLF